MKLLRNKINQGKVFWKKRLYLKPMMELCGAINLGFIGRRYTWVNNHTGDGLIKQRIDRGFVDKDWLQSFPMALVTHLQMEASDHCPILIKTLMPENRGRRHFRFLQAWSTELSFFDIINKSWNKNLMHGMNCNKLFRSLKHTTSALKIWNIEVFGFANKKICSLEAELLTLQE